MTWPKILARTSFQPQGLGVKFAGGWFFRLYNEGNPTGIPIMVTLNADGSVLFSGAPLGGGNFVSSAHGSWKSVEPRTIVGAAQSIAANSEGVPQFYEKGPFQWTLSDDGNQLEGTVDIGLYPAEQDPLVDDPAWGVVSFTCVGRRVAAQ